MSERDWTIDRVEFSREVRLPGVWNNPEPMMYGVAYGRTAEGRAFYSVHPITMELWSIKGEAWCEEMVREMSAPPPE
jgi:hypothetical protein